MKSPAVQAWCTGLWDSRAAGRLPDAGELSRGLHAAIGRDVADRPSYDPEADRRVDWARQVIRQRRLLRPQCFPLADGDLEALAAWLLDREPQPCGKDLAARN